MPGKDQDSLAERMLKIDARQKMAQGRGSEAAMGMMVANSLQQPQYNLPQGSTSHHVFYHN
jgi:hypothetical protein